MSEEAPDLPEVETAEMAQLKTLGQIVDYMKDSVGDAVVTAASAPAPAAAAPTIDLQALLLTVVADKTGYPADMLTLDMALETDLGIDSIKRVEILAAMSEEAPDLPEVDTAEMAQLKTLGQIVEYMQTSIGTPAPAATAPAPAAAAPSIDLKGLLLSVVADKTGYPADMLTLDMALETDLGIDSIKRVEILAAMSEEAPDLPEVDTAEMAQLKTLGQIVDYMASTTGGAAATTTETATTAAPALALELGRWVLDEVPAPGNGLGLSGLATATRVVVTDDGNGIAQALATQLNAAGHATEITDDVPADADVVIFLGGLRDDADLDTNRLAFKAARALGSKFEGIFVTVQDTGGDFGLSGSDRAWIGGLPGLAKTAAQEWPAAAVRAIDLERGGRTAAELAGALLEELYKGGAELEIGLHADGRRTTLASVKTAVEGGSASVNSKSFIVASGGARGVTAATLIALAKATQTRIALLGRTVLADEPAACAGIEGDANLKKALLTAARASGSTPSPAELGKQVRGIQAVREIQGTLQSLKAAGSDAEYLSVDVTNSAALDKALAPLRATWGRVTGIVHGAGVLADKFIADKTDDQFNRVFDTKVLGLQSLLAATADDSLETVVMFSSVAARSGNAGQCDYAMANEILNKVGALLHRTNPKCLVKSLNWGPWEGGMVTPALKAHFEAAGVPLIPLEVGGQMLVDELLNSDPSRVELVLGGPPRQEALISTGTDLRKAFDVRVGRSTHPELTDHSIKNVPVLPVVQVMDWFQRAAKATRPDLELVECTDLKVLKGIQLGGFDQTGDHFSISCNQISNGDGARLGLELRSPDNTLHYSAVAEMHDNAPADGPSAPAPAAYETWGTGEVYDGQVLFHGPQFQVIQKLDGVSDDGIAAQLEGNTDISLMDGGLQLALLWVKHKLGAASLPTRVGAYRGYKPLAGGPIECVARCRVVGKSKTVTDVKFVSNGQVIAELDDVETVVLPA